MGHARQGGRVAGRQAGRQAGRLVVVVAAVAAPLPQHAAAAISVFFALAPIAGSQVESGGGKAHHKILG